MGCDRWRGGLWRFCDGVDFSGGIWYIKIIRETSSRNLSLNMVEISPIGDIFLSSGYDAT